MMEIQINKRVACLIMPITRNIANTATIIKNGGELINSGMANSMSCVVMRCGTANMFSPCGFWFNTDIKDVGGSVLNLAPP